MAASSQSAPPAPTSSSSSTTSAAAANAVHDPQWRLPGQHHRSYLLSTDEECGGSDFSLNPTVPITKYYQVSRRAYHQFRDSVAHRNENNVDEIYLMGNRLIKFISSVLPQHSQYGSNHEDLVEARDEVKLVLVEAGRLLSEVALYIDRLEWARVREEQEQVEEEEEEEEELGDEHDEDDAAWEADFAAFGTSSSAATSPHRLRKEITPILYSKSSTPRRSKNKGPNQRKVSFSPDVKPGKDDTLLTIVDLSSDTSTSIDLSIDRGVDGDHELRNDDNEPEPCINSSTLDLSFSVSSSSSSPSRSTSLDDSEIDLEDEHRTFLQMTRMEFCSSSSFDAGADDDGGKDSVENEDDVDISIDEDQVVAAATSGSSSPTKQEHLDQTERALAELTEATQALSVRVRRYETEEIDDAPTDEEHTDVEDNGDKDEDDEDDEFAAAPLNDVSGSSILADSDDDDDDSNEEDDDDDRLSFIQRVALENFTNDFNKTTIQAGADDDDSDAVDSWAQDGDGDGDDDFDTTTNSESGENGDFGGDGFLHSELGFDGPLPTFPSDGHDPFLLDKDAPWPDDADASPLGETFDFSAHGFGFGNNANNAGKHDSKPSSGILGASKRTLSKDDLLAGSASGTDADETAPTLPSSSGSYEFHGEVMSIGSAAAASASARDDSVPDRLDYLESKLQALQHSRSGVLVEMMEGDRCPSPTIVGEDEVEV